MPNLGGYAVYVKCHLKGSNSWEFKFTTGFTTERVFFRYTPAAELL